MDEKIKLLISTLGENRIKQNENLKHFTYTKIDVSAEYFYIVTTQKEIREILNSCFELKIPFFIFGNGTKLVVKRPFIKGLVIKNRTGGIKIGGIKGKVGPSGIGVEEALIETDSGVSIEKFNDYLKNQQLRNLLTNSSAKSSIGGSLFLDTDLKQVCQKVTVWKKGKIWDIDPYSLEKEMIILSAVFKVKAL